MPPEYHQKMSNRYQEIGRAQGWKVLDGAKPIETIHQLILDEVKLILP
jgi:thymidylate kinase